MCAGLPCVMPVSTLNVPRFDNALLRTLPGDAEVRVFPRQVQGALWSAVEPSPVLAPRLLAHSREMAAELGFSESDVVSPEFAQVFGGNALLPGMQPFANNYGGHQFGHWAGQLGDGRAISLGAVVLYTFTPHVWARCAVKYSATAGGSHTGSSICQT